MLNVEVDLVGDLGALAGSLGGLGEVDESEGQDDQHGEKDTLDARHLVRLMFSTKRKSASGEIRRTASWRRRDTTT